MKVIFIKDVARIGRKGEVKEVAEGYARNFLFARGFAQSATTERIASAELSKKSADAHQEVQKNLLLKNLAALESAEISISAKANEQGHLFRGIHEKEIVEALKKQGLRDFSEEHLILDLPIKMAGKHCVIVEILGRRGSFTLTVDPD